MNETQRKNADPSEASASTVAWLLCELCVELGFCLPPEAQRRLQSALPAGAEAFADAVLAAEGMDPQTADPRLRQQVSARIAKHFQETEVPGTD
jgi:hypothetical protein